MNLSSGAAFKPVSITPDLWYGVNDDVTIGLVHSGVGATGFLDGVGNSLCITGSDNGCGHVYNNVGLDGRIRITKPWAVDVGLFINSISDPFQLAAKLGIDGRWTWNKVSLELQPSFFLGLTNREPMATGMVVVATNTETLYVPATLELSGRAEVRSRVPDGPRPAIHEHERHVGDSAVDRRALRGVAEVRPRPRVLVPGSDRWGQHRRGSHALARRFVCVLSGSS